VAALAEQGGRKRRGRPIAAVLRAFAGGLVVMMLVMAAVAMIDSAERDGHRVQRRADAMLYASVVRAKLEGTVQQRLRIAYGLAAFARSQFDELPANFYKFAEALMQSGVSGIRSLQLAPDAVVRYVYPYTGNEKAMGHDLLSDPNRRDAVRKAIEQRLFVVAGPFDLIQGGKGLVARLPIYRTTDVGETFWGFATVVMDAEPLFEAANLPTSPEAFYQVAVRGTDGLGERGGVFFGDAGLFAQDPVVLDVALPSGRWQVAVVPHGGWGSVAPSTGYTWAIGTTLSLVAGLLTMLLLLAPEALRRQVARATVALRESEEQFRRVSESATDAIVSIDAEGRVVFWNRAAEANFGYTSAEVIGKPVSMLMPPRFRSQHDEGFARVIAGERPRRAGSTFEVTGLHKNGSEFPIELSNAVWSAGGVTYVTAIIRNISERRRAEREQAQLRERFHQVQRMEAIGTLASGAAHEFNNILNAIMAHADSAAMNLSPQDPAAQAVAEIQEGAWRAADIVRRLLVFGEREADAVAPVSLSRVVEDTIADLRRAVPPWVSLDVAVPDGAATDVACDSAQLAQVVTSLCVNALQATEGGATRIGVEVARWDELVCPLPATGGEAQLELGHLARWPAVALTVADDGCGMTQAVLSRAFEPFFTTRKVGSGSGLGLAVVHGVVQRCGGAVAVRSGPQQGTTVTILFPAAEVEPDRPSEIVADATI